MISYKEATQHGKVFSVMLDRDTLLAWINFPKDKTKTSVLVKINVYTGKVTQTVSSNFWDSSYSPPLRSPEYNTVVSNRHTKHITIKDGDGRNSVPIGNVLVNGKIVDHYFVDVSFRWIDKQHLLIEDHCGLRIVNRQTRKRNILTSYHKAYPKICQKKTKG